MRTPLLLALATLSLAAQDRFTAGLSLSSQSGAFQSLPLANMESRQRIQVGVEGGWRAARFGRMDLRVTGALRFESKAKVDGRSSLFQIDEQIADISQSSQSLGAEVSWRLPVDLGAGLEVRRERLTWLPRDPEIFSVVATQVRPWITAHVGWTWKIQGMRPFLRGQMALALTQEDLDGNAHITSDAEERAYLERLTKSLAPKAEVTLQAGLRF